MSPRRQSGYDPVGDPRTGRPPLPDERERARQAMPDEMDAAASGASGGESAAQAEGPNSMIGKTLGGSSEDKRSLRSAGEAVSSQVAAATTAAMERGSELASTASEQVQSYAGELVAFTRRRPLAALMGAAIFGLLIGMFRRNRSSG
jgi:hypothetical protein